MYQGPQAGAPAQILHHSTLYCLTTMTAILAAVVMLQALVTGDCLIYEQCFAIHTSSCSGIFKQCSPDVTHCVTGLENNTMGNDIILTAFKGCLKPSQRGACGRELSFKTSVVSFHISRTCCDFDFCNGGDVQVFAVNNTPNGYKCGACFIDQSADGCTATGEIQCTGKQSLCGSFSGTYARPGEASRENSAKGCVSPDFCKRGVFNVAGTQGEVYRAECSPALKL